MEEAKSRRTVLAVKREGTKLHKKCYFAAALSVCFLSAWSANAMSGAGAACTDNQNVREATMCLDKALANAEKALNEKYAAVKKLSLMTDKGLQKKLARNQTAWKIYVAQTCDDLIAHSAKEEPIGPADVLSCKVELTIERTSDLDRMFYIPLHH